MESLARVYKDILQLLLELIRRKNINMTLRTKACTEIGLAEGDWNNPSDLFIKFATLRSTQNSASEPVVTSLSHKKVAGQSCGDTWKAEFCQRSRKALLVQQMESDAPLRVPSPSLELPTARNANGLRPLSYGNSWWSHSSSYILWNNL